MFLFGGSEPWSPHDWTSSDDRVRGGSSQSYLDCTSRTSALFHGTLDTTTLGGAGFASQRTTRDSPTQNLAAYDGLELVIDSTDGKRYTLILKNELLPRRPDGREQSSLSYEYDFALPAGSQTTTLFIAWNDFRPTYRGRAVEPPEKAPPLDAARIASFAIMMRSFFGAQQGDFHLRIASIAASSRHSKGALDVDGESVDSYTEKDLPKRQGWARWVFGGCGIL